MPLSRLVLATLLLAACREEAPQAMLFDAARDSVADLAAARAEARATGRRILLEVGYNACPWTRKMDGLLTTDRELATLVAERFVHVRVNRTDEQPNATLLGQLPEIPGVPHFFVLDADGRLLHSQETGALEVGDRHDRAKVLAFLTRWAR
jgi:thioredoxin-related protein